MYCVSCGVAVSETENFCYRCGASLRDSTPRPVAPAPSQPARAATHSRSIVPGYIYVVVGVASALLGSFLRASAASAEAWWAGVHLGRGAVVWLVAGIPLCVLFLWRGGGRRARLHARVICALLLLSLVVAILLGLGAQEINSYLEELRDSLHG